MAQVIESGKAIRLESGDPLARRQEWREWKARGYRVPAPDGAVVWHEREAIRRAVLETFRDIDADIFLFGSRASGAARNRSDYDVGFLAGEPVPAERLSHLRGHLEELPIPSHVEVVDFCTVPQPFADLVLEHREELEVWKTRQSNSLFT